VLVVKAQVAVVAVVKAEREVLAVLDSYKSSIKMYAITLNDMVLGPFVGEKEELEQVQAEYPNHKFIEMTKENSPAFVGKTLKGSD
jgi:hypothetical protein